MDDCRRFEQIQLAALLGDASQGLRQWAQRHARSCEDCHRSHIQDRWLDAAFALSVRETAKGHAGAHQKLEKAIRGKRAVCGCVDGPIGRVYLARTERGVCRVSFRCTEEDFMEELERNALLPEFAPLKLIRETRQLEAYFSGRGRDFRLPVDLRMVSPFQRRVLEATSRIPFGQVVSYSDVARRIGRAEARRAVGGALGKNPVAIIIPCHRVIAADGTIGGYTGGLDIKRELMRIEGITLEKEEL